MATETKKIIKEFNLEEALRGGKIAFVNNPEAHISNITENNITSYVEYFQSVDSSSKATQYKGVVGTTKYYFDYKGRPADNVPEHRLFSVDAQIKTSQGTVATRGDAVGGEVVNIVALQPREQFAMAAMKGILYHIVDPTYMSNAQVLDVVNMSFNIANAMMQKAADVRAELEDNGSSTNGREEEIKVNPEELTENRDKILYNLNENLFKVVDQMSDKGLRIKPTDDAQFKVANVSGTKLQAEVTNTVKVDGTMDATIVASTIDVPVDIQNNPVPISGNVNADVSGTVSVDNFPSSVRVSNIPSSISVDNIPSEPIDVNVTNTVEITGTVSTAGSGSGPTEPTDPEGQT